MSIRKSLGNLVIACGGTPTSTSVRGLIGDIAVALGGSGNGKTVAEQIDKIVMVKDPLFGLKVDANIANSVDLLGKTINDLQTGVVVENDSIKGTLKYVDDYTGFSSNLKQQKGHYLAIHAEVPDVEDVTIKVKMKEEVTLDSDGIYIGWFEENSTTDMVVTASASGKATVKKVYSLKGLTFEPEPEEE